MLHTLETKEVDEVSYASFFTFVAVAVVIGAVIGFGLTHLNKKQPAMVLQQKIPLNQPASSIKKLLKIALKEYSEREVSMAKVISI